MAQRSLWRGAISFGLIYVPIEMYSASKEHALNLHFLYSRVFLGCRIHFDRHIDQAK